MTSRKYPFLLSQPLSESCFPVSVSAESARPMTRFLLVSFPSEQALDPSRIADIPGFPWPVRSKLWMSGGTLHSIYWSLRHGTPLLWAGLELL